MTSWIGCPCCETQFDLNVMNAAGRENTVKALVKAITFHEAAPDMFEATTGLVNSLPDNLIDWARDGIGNSNAGVIIHWRDRVKAALELATGESDETK